MQQIMDLQHSKVKYFVSSSNRVFVKWLCNWKIHEDSHGGCGNKSKNMRIKNEGEIKLYTKIKRKNEMTWEAAYFCSLQSSNCAVSRIATWSTYANRNSGISIIYTTFSHCMSKYNKKNSTHFQHMHFQHRQNSTLTIRQNIMNIFTNKLKNDDYCLSF